MINLSIDSSRPSPKIRPIPRAVVSHAPWLYRGELGILRAMGGRLRNVFACYRTFFFNATKCNLYIPLFFDIWG